MLSGTGCGVQMGVNPDALLDIPIEPDASVAVCTGWDPRAEEHSPTFDTWVKGNHVVYEESDLRHHTDGDYDVIVGPGIAGATADFYLEMLPQYTDRIVDFFEMNIPWRGHMGLWLLPCERGFCSNAGGTGDAGQTFMTYGEDLLPGLNQAASEGRVFFEGVFLHELSHALRTGIAAPSLGIEEGLATFTRIHLQSTDTENIDLSSGYYLVVDYICEEEGFRQVELERREDGSFREYVGDFHPYYDSNGDVEETGWCPFDCYITNFCFWETLRNLYGQTAVVNLVRSMVDFSKGHQNNRTSFPFFESFRNVTGMNEEEAQQYFDRFYLPTEDSNYQIGGVCW